MHALRRTELARAIPDPPPQRDGTFPPAAKRTLRLRRHPSRHALAQKSFAHWAPHVLEQALDGTLLPPDIKRPPREAPPEKTIQPPDEHAAERANFQGRLTFEFAGTHEVVKGGVVHVGTDGGRDVIRGEVRAGAGIFYGDNNTKNAAFRVTTPPTAQRAELEAFLYVLRTEERPLCVRTDSSYVHNGFTTRRHVWRANAFFHHPLNAEERAHSDLWREVDRLLAKRPPNTVETQWVKGHPLPEHIQQGRTTEVDAWLNTGADGLATHAMHWHKPGASPLRWTSESAGLRRVELSTGPQGAEGLHHDLRT